MKRAQPKTNEFDAQAIAEARMRSRQIGRALYIAFDAVTREPIPFEFLDMFRQLDERERLSRSEDKKVC